MAGLDIQKISSPNFNERKARISLQYIVLHYTGMKTPEEWIAAVCDPKVELSAHYLVCEDGRVVQLVDEDKRAWHAGKSYWRGITDMNSASIGIEIQNPGHVYGYRPFPAAQIEALKKLLWDIVGRNGLDARRCLLAHSDIASTRKIDPGELFPWRALAEEGLGVWPEGCAGEYPPPQPSPQGGRGLVRAGGVVPELLSAIGYDCSDEAVAQASLSAFLRRFHPERLELGPDDETMARMQAVQQLLT